MDGIAASALAELAGDQLGERIYRLLFVGTISSHDDLGAALRGEHHDAHNTLAVHVEIITHECDVRSEAGRGLNDAGRRTGVNSVAVHYCDPTFDHQRTTE
jgi:hypothetical protein